MPWRIPGCDKNNKNAEGKTNIHLALMQSFEDDTPLCRSNCTIKDNSYYQFGYYYAAPPVKYWQPLNVAGFQHCLQSYVLVQKGKKRVDSKMFCSVLCKVYIHGATTWC